MPDLSDADREELGRLRELVGEDVEVPSQPEVPGEFHRIDPMLAETFDGELSTLEEDRWLAENKYDGTRLIVERFDDEIRAYTRRGVDRVEAIPTVVDGLEELPNGTILDGELTFLDSDGTSQFRPIHADGDRLAEAGLTPTLFCFDLLYAEGDVTDQPLTERKDRLVDIVPAGDAVAVADHETADFQAFFDSRVDAGEEGIMLKRRESRYYRGVRSDQWQKVKHFTERDALAVGYTEGEGTRAATFGALVLSDGLSCLGRVGSGFSEAELAEIAGGFEPVDERPFPEAAAGMAYTPIDPFVVEVRYQEVTGDGKLRAPVFVRTRPEKPIDDVEPIES